MDKAQELYHNGSIEGAISAYDEALKIDPENETILIRKASDLLVVGRVNESVEACDMALDAYNETPGLTSPAMMDEPWLWKGEALAALGKGDEAALAYEQAFERFEIDTTAYPEIAKFWMFKARALEGMGRHEEAALSYERAVEAFEDEIETHAESSNVWRYQWMGEALEALGRDSEAEDAYARARLSFTLN